MKGVVLAGGMGSRLDPLTKATNKHLLPVYDKPMVYYPIQTLVDAGIKDVMVITSGPHAGDFISILKNGEEFGLDSLQYGYQWKPNGGIADALAIARDFVGNDDVCVILGDNTTDADISNGINTFNSTENKVKNGAGNLLLPVIGSTGIPRAHVFLSQVEDPHRYGVASFENDSSDKISKIEEKPTEPDTDYAVTGLYVYDSNVFKFIDKCEPSKRGELEITDVNNFYIQDGILTCSMLQGFWKDAGTFQSLYEANVHWARKEASKESIQLLIDKANERARKAQTYSCICEEPGVTYSDQFTSVLLCSNCNRIAREGFDLYE